MYNNSFILSTYYSKLSKQKYINLNNNPIYKQKNYIMKEKKQTLWFSHDGTAARDRKLKALIGDHGMAGYGRWWRVVVELRMQDDYRLDISPGYTWKVLGHELCCKPEEANAFITECIEVYELLQTDGQYIWSESLIARMQFWDGKREERIERARRGGIAKRDKQRSAQAAAQNMLKQDRGIY